jgi:uncharacterized Fe-S cluster-containing radical SAM superfamily protein
MRNLINTEKFSLHLRERAINTTSEEVLLTNFSGSQQEKDLTEPTNCKGFGRIRHFKLETSSGWVKNPLPILPALKILGIQPETEIRAQVFQNSVCNWRCWYCFVDTNLLNGDLKRASFLNCDEMLDLYLMDENPAQMLDLSGGQPDLTPEWIPWMMQALKKRSLDDKIYLWSDDNLSNDYFWKYLSTKEIELVATYKNYGRVCCFKGFDEESFSFNTLAEPNLFLNQFKLFEKLLGIGIDLYAYVTLTTPNRISITNNLPSFLDELQKINVNLPLRTIPLEVQVFSPVLYRMNEEKRRSITNQWFAIELWQKELESRFPSGLRETNITEVKIGS